MRPLALLRPATELLGLSPSARRFAIRAWLAVPVMRSSLALLGLRTTLRWIEAVPASPTLTNTVGVCEGSGLVQRAFHRHPFGGACLPQSLVQYALHRRDGVSARLVVGVHRAGTSDLRAHAWVEGLEDIEPVEHSGGNDFAPLFVTGAAHS